MITEALNQDKRPVYGSACTFIRGMVKAQAETLGQYTGPLSVFTSTNNYLSALNQLGVSQATCDKGPLTGNTFTKSRTDPNPN